MFIVASFYKYILIEAPEQLAATHLKLCKKLGILGRIYIAEEGINGQISAPQEAYESYKEYMSKHPLFSDLVFKVHTATQPAFRKIHVRHKKEIVASGFGSDVNPAVRTGKHLTSEEFKLAIDDEDVVLLDVRSEYETKIGKFKGAKKLPLQNFRELPSLFSELEEYKDKKIITYCTGGIKCEKASALLIKAGFKDVSQLQGGILKYAEDTGGKDFEGKLYVFDHRVSIDINHINPTIISVCTHCNQPSGRSVNCSNPLCNEQFVLCETCGYPWEGACSIECKMHPERRSYNGTGFYTRPGSTM